MEENRNDSLDEALITAWVGLTSTLKNTRLTQGLNYNEAIVMNIAYHNFLDGEKPTSFKRIVQTTRMLKSLVNRTIDSLAAKNLLERFGGEDKRTTFVRPVRENLGRFLEVHEQSLALAREIRAIIGEEDAKTFVRIAEKLVEADPLDGGRE